MVRVSGDLGRIVGETPPAEHLRLDPLEEDLVRVEQLLMQELTGRDRFLDEVTSHLAAAGGKRLRPILTLCGAYAGQRGLALEPAPEAAIVAAAAVEALHLCTLYHDDVIDDATLRRGVPSANARWHNSVAVIGGDILLARAFRLGASIGSAGAALLARALEDLCAGQADEFSSLYDPHRDEAAYELAIAGKTAALMAASLQVGGLAAAALSPADLERLSIAGHELGIAFQLIDDLLDLLGSTSAIGKPAGEDIVNGVYTLPVILELRTNARLRVLLGSPPSAAEAEEARQLVLAGTGPAAAVGCAREHVGRALAVLDRCGLHPAVTQAVAWLGDLIFEPIRSPQAPGGGDPLSARTMSGGAGSLRLLAADDQTHELISQWLRSCITRPHPELGRPGAVCPFVAPALATDKVTIAAYRFGAEPSLERMTRALEQAIECFRELVREQDEPDLVSLIVAFPDLGPAHWRLIDDGHSANKTRFVADGLMLGQFHPACEAPAAHNPAFPVNRAPIPLMVIRHMAVHDILFLEEDPVWVEHYTAWLARRRITLNHPLYRRRFEQALGRRAP